MCSPSHRCRPARSVFCQTVRAGVPFLWPSLRRSPTARLCGRCDVGHIAQIGAFNFESQHCCIANSLQWSLKDPAPITCLYIAEGLRALLCTTRDLFGFAEQAAASYDTLTLFLETWHPSSLCVDQLQPHLDGPACPLAKKPLCQPFCPNPLMVLGAEVLILETSYHQKAVCGVLLHS